MAPDRNDPRATFSRSARLYLDSSDHRSGPDLEIIGQVASRQFPAVTVDVASGAGHALRPAYPYSGLCLALDLTLEMLQVARRHLNGAGLTHVRYLQAAADQLPLKNGGVSLVTCRIAPHHFRTVSGFLLEVERVLEPGGSAVIIDSVVPEEGDVDRFLNGVEKLRDPSHVRSHTLRKWLQLLEEAGLRTISAELFEREHAFAEWAARTGLDKRTILELETAFQEAPAPVRDRLKVRLDAGGRVLSYTDDKGIFVVRKGGR